MLLFRGTLLALYSLEGSAADIAEQMIIILAVFLPFAFFENTLLYGVSRGIGKLKFVFYCDLIAVIGITLPSGFIAAGLGASPFLIYGILRSELIFKCIPAFLSARSIESATRPRLK
jgi:Na+-driven multidrug efflux pump